MRSLQNEKTYISRGRSSKTQYKALQPMQGCENKVKNKITIK